MVGRQLLRPRVGSICEDEVGSLLRRIAFVNRPLTPDDIGADFVCSVAEQLTINNDAEQLSPMLYSGSWFLVSVKSGDASIGLEKSARHFQWFLNLELPFFVAQVEKGTDLRVNIYHTLQQIYAVKNLPSTVKKLRFKCMTSPDYMPRNYRIDRKDVIEINNEVANAWLGPPLLELNRARLLNKDFTLKASRLLQNVCDIHPAIRSSALSGIDTGVMWETNTSLETPVRPYHLGSLVANTAKSVSELEEVLQHLRTKPIIEDVWQASQPLFRFIRESNKLQCGERTTDIQYEEIFQKKPKC